MSNFLPKDYKIPVDSNYFKFQPGENKFRVLDSAIIGQEFWVGSGGERRPVRKQQNERISPNELDDNSTIKHFWAFPVWNITAQKVQIMFLTQKTIMNDIHKLVSNDDWGDPKDYDITITKEGEGLNTKYHTIPSPKKKLDPGIVQMYKDMNIDLNQLYSNGDPFGSPLKLISEEVDPDSIPDDLSELMK